MHQEPAEGCWVSMILSCSPTEKGVMNENELEKKETDMELNSCVQLIKGTAVMSVR